MIGQWLKKHWYINEAGKFIVSCFFGYSAWALWQAGLSTENTTGTIVLGWGSGMFSIITIAILVDIGAVLLDVIRRKPLYKD